MADSVLVEDDAGVRTITLNRPDCLNAVDLPMILQLEAVVRSAQNDDAVRVLILKGAGRSFCAGDDVLAQTAICEAGEAALRDQLRHLQAISELLTLGDKPVVAAVRGWAVGAGFSWMLNCDFRLWTEGAGGFLPEVSFGTFVTGGATFLLPAAVGLQRASDLLFLGRRVRTAEANALGLLHAVHGEADLDHAAATLARSLADLPPMALRRMKRAVTCGWAKDFRAALHHETEACVATTLHPQTLARMRAAITKD